MLIQKTKGKYMTNQFLALINNCPVYRTDLNAEGKKNTRDYAYGVAHYSVGDKFKAEVIFTDKTETVIREVVIKNKTFNKTVAVFNYAESMSALKHALDNRVMMTRFNTTRGIAYQAELDKLANRLH